MKADYSCKNQVDRKYYLSIFADQPNFPDTSTQGDELIRLETWTLATLSPRFCFIQSHKRVYSFSTSFSFSSSTSPAKTQKIILWWDTGFIGWQCTCGLQSGTHWLTNTYHIWLVEQLTMVCLHEIVNSLPKSRSSLLISTNFLSLYDWRFVIATSSIGSTRNRTCTNPPIVKDSKLLDPCKVIL